MKLQVVHLLLERVGSAKNHVDQTRVTYQEVLRLHHTFISISVVQLLWTRSY